MSIPKKNKMLASLVDYVLSSKHSSFYREHFRKGDVTSFDGQIQSLPLLTWENLALTPLAERIYTNDATFTKVTYHPKKENPLLTARTKADIAEENFGEIPTRPLVFFENVHEALEKSMWCYEKNILPLIAEGSVSVIKSTAEQYQADGIIADTHSILTLIEHLREGELSSVVHITAIGTAFNREKMSSFFKHTSYSLILSLPEVGTLAHACKENPSVFHPDEKTLIEIQDTLVVSRLIKLPTPIIRYKTDIKATEVEPTCSCKEKISFTIQ